MLLEMYLTLEIVAFICFGIAFFRKNEWFWALSIILLAMLVFASYNIEQNVSVVANQTMVGNTITYQHEIVTKQVTDKAYSYLNIGLGLIAILLFLNDLFMNWKDGRSGEREL